MIQHRRRVLKSHFKALSDELQTAGGMTKITKAGTLDRGELAPYFHGFV